MTAPTTTAPITLVRPSAAMLPQYAAALESGWSPTTTHDVSKQQLAALRRDPVGFLRDLTAQTGTIELANGHRVPRLSLRLFWISDGAFCGMISLRFKPGTEALPPQVSGHIGYSLVPWKRRRGYATRALALMLPIAREQGLARVLITCDEDNIASRKVIEANDGVLSGTAPSERHGVRKLLFWVPTERSA